MNIFVVKLFQEFLGHIILFTCLFTFQFTTGNFRIYFVLSIAENMWKEGSLCFQWTSHLCFDLDGISSLGVSPCTFCFVCDDGDRSCSVYDAPYDIFFDSFYTFGVTWMVGHSRQVFVLPYLVDLPDRLACWCRRISNFLPLGKGLVDCLPLLSKQVLVAQDYQYLEVDQRKWKYWKKLGPRLLFWHYLGPLYCRKLHNRYYNENQII